MLPSGILAADGVAALIAERSDSHQIQDRAQSENGDTFSHCEGCRLVESYSVHVFAVDRRSLDDCHLKVAVLIGKR